MVRDMATAPLLLSADGLSPYDEKQLLSALSFCFFKSILMKKVVEKVSDWPGCVQPAVAGTGDRVVEENGSWLRKPPGWSGG